MYNLETKTSKGEFYKRVKNLWTRQKEQVFIFYSLSCDIYTHSLTVRLNKNAGKSLHSTK